MEKEKLALEQEAAAAIHLRLQREREDRAALEEEVRPRNNEICFTGINWKIVFTYEPKIMLTNSPTCHRRVTLVSPEGYVSVAEGLR